MGTLPRVTVWNEYRHERNEEHIRAVYPDGIHAVIAEGLRGHGFEVGTATLDEPEHGLTEEVLANTDVLVWWGHQVHHEVDWEIVKRVQKRIVEEGMGLVTLHSGHMSRIFMTLMGTTCDLKWREADDRERLWVVDPTHPITDGVPECIVLEAEEMYGEHFDVPAPDELIFVSWFTGGEVFRSGATWKRGLGKIFYFRPGHESYPTYYNPEIMKVIANGVKWAAPSGVGSAVRGNIKVGPEVARLQTA